MNPTGKYRQLGEPTNAKCGDCKKPIWCRTGIHTCYHGMKYYNADVSIGKPESVAILDPISWQNKGFEIKIVCCECGAKYLERQEGVEL